MISILPPFQVFWQRYKELSDWEKVTKNIERGEQKLQRFQDNQNAVASKLSKYKNPWVELKVCGCVNQPPLGGGGEVAKGKD